MRKYFVSCMIVLLLMPRCAQAENGSVDQTREALRKSTAYLRSVSTNGGYAGIYSLDLKKRYGESFRQSLKPTEIWIQPPGTPSVGECFLRAYEITGEPEYLKAARNAGEALVWGQREAGGWDHTADVASLREDSTSPARISGPCTFDDNITQGALSFLISLDSVVDEEWLSEGIRIGLDHVVNSQFENGAWPQWNPPKRRHKLTDRYHGHYTFNDAAINDCISVMLKAHRTYGKDRYLRSATLGGDFIISSQLAAPQAGWAQQYSRDMKPAWARSFEPPGVCSAVTARNIRTLADLYLYTKDERYLAPVPSAIAWLENSKIGENLWSRLYELGTNKPIYGDRDGKVHYDYEEISEERKAGYQWKGEFEVPAAIQFYEKVKKQTATGDPAASPQSATPAEQKQKAEQLAAEVRKLVATLDEKGRWTEGDWIYTGTFVRNINVLCEYLEILNPAEGG